MNFNEYQRTALNTAVYPGQGEVGGLIYATLGLAGEAGEVANKVKKILRDNSGELTPEARDALIGELGDTLWYLSQVATELDTFLSDLAERNLRKLFARKESGTIHGEGDNR